MNMFIKVTCGTDEFRLSAAHIVEYGKDRIEGSYIITSTGGDYTVKETPEEIDEMIRYALTGAL